MTGIAVIGIDHLYISVSDMTRSERFYDRLMPLLGFDPARRSEATLDAHEMHVVEYVADGLCIAISSPRAAFASEPVHRRKPGALHHLAFRASSRAEVDDFHAKLVELDADIVEPPRAYPQHGEHYYAVFFKDPCGVKLEVMCEGPA